MVRCLHLTPVSDCLVCSDSGWNELYSSLRSRAKGTTSGFSPWQVQRYDAEEDFVQESIVRAYIYCLRSNHDGNPIKSPKHFTMAIMHNYCEDTRRKDRRLTHLSQLQDSKREYLARTELIDPSEIATESVFQEQLFLLIAKEVVNFPAKQRQALLIDLANSMSFDECPTPLQKAFQKVGIRLQDYQLPLPDDPVERSRFSSNLHHAYNRIANLECVQQYIAA